MKRRELLIVDAQNDFCMPEGALYVQGAEEDCRRLASFIREQGDSIENITVTLDSHHLYDIAHPLYWIDEKGNHPDPFTVISKEDVESGVWKTSRREEQNHGLEYVRTLEEKGKYKLCIWPPHCLIGSRGTQLQDDVFQALCEWETKQGKAARKIFKGTDSGTEHYGAFEAEVPSEEDKSSLISHEIIAELDRCDEILVAGEALDYCVASTVRQLADSLPSGDCSKIVLLENCVSPVDPSSGLSDAFVEELKGRGMRIL